MRYDTEQMDMTYSVGVLAHKDGIYKNYSEAKKAALEHIDTAIRDLKETRKQILAERKSECVPLEWSQEEGRYTEVRA